jgi:hypothetical protein
MSSSVGIEKPSDRYASVIKVLDRFVQTNEEPLELLVDLFNEVRPNGKLSRAEAATKYVFIISTISANEAYRTAVREKTLDLFSRCNQVTFYSDAGILPNTGFFVELLRRISHRSCPKYEIQILSRILLVRFSTAIVMICLLKLLKDLRHSGAIFVSETRNEGKFFLRNSTKFFRHCRSCRLGLRR